MADALVACRMRPPSLRTAAPARTARDWAAAGLRAEIDGRLADACESFRQASRLDAANLAYLRRRAELAAATGEGEVELASADAARARRPDDVAALALRGFVLAALGQTAAAIDALQVAAMLAPAVAPLHAALGACLMHELRLDEAETALDAALALDPADVESLHLRAVALMRRQRNAAALERLAPVLREHAHRIDMRCNAANALLALGRQAEARAMLEEAAADAPESEFVRRGLMNVLAYCDGVDGTTLLQAARACAEALPRPATGALASPHAPAMRRSRLRVGLLSGTLKQHPVGFLTIAGLEALDMAAFDLHCFSMTEPRDHLAARFRALGTWHALAGRGTEEIAAAIRAAEIDVLIDLGGWGDLGRVEVCASRPAPVQIKWVGMQTHSTGMPEIDFFLTDRWSTPEGYERFYSERLLRLDDGYVCYAPPEDTPPVAPLPALQRGYVTFGCFNNLAKITPRVVETWARVLAAVPGARLRLKTHQLSEADVASAWRERFAQAGIAPERIELAARSPHRAFLAAFADVDMLLDPFPYSGGLTTCEALWMGVPTLTMPGESFSSRHSLSHMSNVGLGDWAVADTDAYVAMAVARAADLPALAALRRGMRARVSASPLCDAPRFGASLGRALRRAWAA